MDFFRRVFKSDSKTELQTPPGGSDSDGSLFGGLDVNETEPSLEETPERSPSPTIQPSTESGAFTSEFSFINTASPQRPANGVLDRASTSASSTVIKPADEPTSSSSIPFNPNSKSSESPKPKRKGDSAQQGAESTSSTTPGKPKKIVKKRTLENRPGYGVDESTTASTAPTPSTIGTEKSPSSATEFTSTVTQASDSDVLPTPTISMVTTLSSTEVTVAGAALDRTKQAMEAPTGTESQESMLEALRLEYEAQVEEFRSRLKLLSDQTRKQYQKSADKLLELGSIEKLLAQLRLDVKAASDDEKYERAAELNMEIDSNLERAETVRRSLEESQDETRKLELQKSSILKEFINAQSTLLFRLSEVKSAQTKVVSHSRDHLSSLKSEAVTVYASKIEMLEERISDVQSEFERIVDREQKLEAKITANCQGISETVKEDSALVMSLEEEIKDLREKLAAKETLLNTVQTRLKSNQSKIDVLRKEHGNYLDEVVSDKSKKLESLAALRSEKSQLDAQIAQQHQRIEKQEASMEQEIKVMASIDKETTIVEDRISMATQTATLFSISIEDAIKEALDLVDNSDSAESTGVAKSGTESSSISTASTRGSAILSSIKQKVSDQRSSISKTEIEISSRKQELKRLKIEQDESRKSVPLLEQSKQVAVSAKDYKEAARLKSEISSVQASIENQKVEMDRITEALKLDQESLISQQAILTDLLTQLDVAESQQASGRLEELSKLIWTAKTEQRRLATISTSGPPESPLHNEALEISQTQLAGFLEVARGESTYLAMKFGLEIPSEIPLEVPEPLTDTTHPQPTEKPSSSPGIIETISEEVLTPDPQTIAPEEDGGLFDGLDEASDNTEEKFTEPKVNESKDEEATQSEKTEDKQSEEEILLLKARIQATEDSLAEAEADEDYERADELHQQVVSLKIALSGLTVMGTED